MNFRWLSVAFLLMFSSSFGQTYFVALSVADIRALYGWSSGDFGAIYMIITLAGAVFLSLIGSVLDYYRFATVCAVSILLLAAGAVLIGLSTSVLVTILGLFLLRLFGQGMMLQIAFTALGRWFVKERGRAVSLSALGLNVGEATLPLGFVILASLYDWRAAWLAAAGLLIVIVLPTLLSLSQSERIPAETTPVVRQSNAKNWRRAEVLRDPYFYTILLGVLPPAAISSAVFFHQDTLSFARSWGDSVFATSLTVYAVTAVSVLLVAGPLVDRFSSLRVTTFHLVPISLGCILLSVFDASWSMYAFMALYAATDAFSLTLVGSLWPDLYGTRYLGSVRGVVSAVFTFATAAGPGLAGFLIDAGIGLDQQILGMGFYCLMIIPVIAVTEQRLRRRLA